MQSLENITVTTREAKEFAIACFEAGTVPFFQSHPGMGKSAMAKQIAKEFKLKLIDLRLSTLDSTYLTGYPDLSGDRARFVPFDVFPLEGDPIPEGYEGWLILLDELNSAHRDTLAAAYRLILDQEVGTHKLHKNCFMMAAGNLATSRAIVNNMGSALDSRMAKFEIRTDHRVFMEDVALPLNFDSRIVAYLNMYHDRINTFSADTPAGTSFCCPRTWEKLSFMIKEQEVEFRKGPLYASVIGSAVALDFIQFCKVYQDLVSFEDIVAAPENVALASDSAIRWALTTICMDRVDSTTFEPICKFIGRLPIEFKILFFSGIKARQPKLLQHPAFHAMVTDISKYLFSNN